MPVNAAVVANRPRITCKTVMWVVSDIFNQLASALTCVYVAFVVAAVAAAVSIYSFWVNLINDVVAMQCCSRPMSGAYRTNQLEA